MKKLALAFLAFFAPALAAAQNDGIETVNVTATRYSGFPTPNTSGLESYTSAAQYFINSALLPTLIALAFIVFLWGVANAYILHPDDESKREAGHKYILWGIIGFVVIFCVWGLVALVGSTLGLQPGGSSPNVPSINL